MSRRADLGFTLVEAVIAITILGILGAMVAVFISAPIQAYIDTSQRAVLTDAAAGSMRRIARDAQAALPNSFRSTSPASTACFEFIPTLGGGRYRAQPKVLGGGDTLDFTAVDTSFDVLSQTRLGNLPTGTKLVAIYNLGIAGADAYAGDALGTNAGTISAASTSSITLSPGKRFPFESPGMRFHVIPNYSVVYSCSGGKLLRSTNPLSATQMGSCPSVGTVLVGNVSACSFSYLSSVTHRAGVLAVSLELTGSNGETVHLYNSISVGNVP
jgi:MSHA biogenesis protein MshO